MRRILDGWWWPAPDRLVKDAHNGEKETAIASKAGPRTAELRIPEGRQESLTAQPGVVLTRQVVTERRPVDVQP